MYSKTVIEKIIDYQARGLSAEETRQALSERDKVKIHINTIYRLRKSPVGLEILHELIRQQERDISRADSEDRSEAMKYRNELIKTYATLLVPQQPLIQNNVSVEHEKNVTVNQLLQRYQQFRRDRDGEPAACSDSSGQSVDQTKANS